MTSNSLSMYAYNVTFKDAATTGDQASLVMNAHGCAPRYDGVRRQRIFSTDATLGGAVTVSAGSTNEFTTGSTVTADTATYSLTYTTGPIKFLLSGDPGDDFVGIFVDGQKTPYVY